MRTLLALAAVILLAGCGISAASPQPSPTPKPRPSPTPVNQPGARFDHPPAMVINPSRHYTATMITNRGVFTITLLPRIAPNTVNNFVFLARHHFYNNIQFFRIIAGFMIQTGDPTNTGYGGPGYVFPDEKVTLRYRPGIVAMANSGPNTNGSQFFIVVGSAGSQLPPKYTIFGKVTQGMNVVEKIASTPVTTSPSGELSEPLTKVVLKRVVIHQS